MMVSDFSVLHRAMNEEQLSAEEFGERNSIELGSSCLKSTMRTQPKEPP